MWLAAEQCPQQPIDIVTRLLGRQALAKLEFDEPDEERIERAPGRQELLSDDGERLSSATMPARAPI